MIAFTAPLWILAGALLAGVPIVLHLIAPRPPARAPLPTARFLTPEARARRSLARRPRDPLLLLLRCLFLLLLASALAGPRILPRRTGTLDIVLLDAAAGPAVPAPLQARLGPRVRPVPFDGYADALRALATVEDDADSVRAWLVTAPRWAAWTPGTTTLRTAWPGAIGLVPLPLDAPPTAPERPAGRALISADDEATRATLAAALAASGFDLPAEAPATVRIEIVAARGEPGVPPLVAGAVVVHDIAGHVLRDERDARIIARWSDGAPAAVVTTGAEPCTVTAGIDPGTQATPSSASLPALLAYLAGACDAAADPAGAMPLDAAARNLLGTADDPEAVAVAALAGAGTGRSLARLLLLCAVAIALLETALLVRADRGTPADRAGTSTP